MAELPRLNVGISLDSTTFIAETRKVEASVRGLGTAIDAQSQTMSNAFGVATGAVRAFTGALAAIGISASISQLLSLSKSALDSAGNLGELAQQAGVTVKELQGLTVAALQVGINQEQLVQSLGQFGRRIGEAADGTGDFRKTLSSLGIATRDSAGQVRGSLAVLRDFADKVRDAGSQTQQLTLASEAFGSRIGSKMLPLLAEGAAGIDKWLTTAERAGLVLGDEFVAKADKASDALATFQFAVAKGFEIGLVEKFGGSIEVTEENLKRITEIGRTFGNVMGTAMEAVIQSFKDLQPFLETTRKEFEAIKSFAEFIFKRPFAQEQLSELNKQIEKQAGGKIGQRMILGRPIPESLATQTGQRMILGRPIPESLAAPPHQLPLTRIPAKELPKPGYSARELQSEREQLAIKATIEAEKKAAEESARIAGQRVEAFEKFAKISDDFTKRAAQQAAARAQAQQSFNADLDDQLKLQDLLLSGVSRESEQYKIQAALLAAKRQLGGELTADQERLVSQLQRQSAAIDLQTEAQDKLKRQAEENEKLLMEPFKNFISSAQSSLAGFFETVFEGGVTTFSDLFNEAKRLAIRFASEMAALLVFNPQLIGGLAGVAGPAAAGFGAGTATPGGAIIPALGPAAAVPWWQQQTTSATALLGAGAAGGFGGMLLGGLFGGRGALGGAVGGGLGAVGGGALAGTGLLGPGIGTAVGALGGGILGSLTGGLLGSLFGGKGQTNQVAIGGGLGAISGSGAAAQFVSGIDKQLQGFLDVTQQATVNRALQLANAVKVEYSKQPSANDLAALAAGRVGPAAAALGLQAGRIAVGTPEEQVANLKAALDILDQIEAMKIGPAATEFRDLNRQFQALADQAVALGISTAGITEAWQQASQALARQQVSRWLNAAEAVGAIDPFRKAFEDLQQSFREAHDNAVQLGISTANLVETWDRANRSLLRQQQAQIDAAVLAIRSPFEALAAPLKTFQADLTTSLLNPLEQFSAAQQKFRETAAAAQRGSIEAIQGLQAAGQAFIQTAGAVGASPAAVSATKEVQSALSSVLGQVSAAQNEAQRGIENAVWGAGQRIVDTLYELVQASRDQIDELRRLQRNIT